MAESTLYDRLGEYDGIRAVVDVFYEKLQDDEELGPFFEDADLEKLRETQTDFLCDAAEGPETYDAEPVREAHLHVPFSPSHIHRAIELLYETLDESGVSDEDADKIVEAIAAYEDELLASPSNDE
ncbi:truncated hemoglobin [Halopenitus persicus]|uniref:Hemoglobin n=1 Tax=Halopenitus persicus TaxID=1048396 RepID=A0A1H3DGL5_9EURY|nr:group 1 truncated hemoglobin [Halopenitus persicus]SDX65511.1 hemoglobin [Halopenitus persicus]